MFRYFFLSVLIILVSLANMSSAVIPKLINYQGMLTDNSGTPLNGTYSITFKIYNAESGGTMKWEETQSSVSVTNGLFNVILGSVTPINLDFSEDYWLDVTVDGETMPSRLKFTSIGYAYRAMVADTAYTTLPGAGSHWSVNDSVLYTNKKWGIARGGASNVLFGDSAYTHVNLGVICTTGVNMDNIRYSTVGGGFGNKASNNYATVGGGFCNTATTHYGVIGGGYRNTASVGYATVAGGSSNDARGNYATVGGGQSNEAWDVGTVGGGSSNIASGQYASVGGGYDNNASGFSATVPGGYRNAASVSCSFAAGYKAKAYHLGAFVWADSSVNANFASTGNNQFVIRAAGGVGIGTNNPEASLHVQDSGECVIKVGTPTTNGNATVIFEEGGNDVMALRYNGTANELRVTDETALATRMVIERAGNVGIGTTTPGTRFAVYGLTSTSSYNYVKVNTATGDFYYQTSSKRYKDDLRPLEDDFDRILQVEPKSFVDKASGQREIGCIAEELDEMGLNNLVIYNKDDQPDGIKYELVSLYLLEVIKELKVKNGELQQRIETLERQ